MSKTFKSIKKGLEEAIDMEKHKNLLKAEAQRDRILGSIERLEKPKAFPRKQKCFCLRERSRLGFIMEVVRTVGVCIVVTIQTLTLLHLLGVL